MNPRSLLAFLLLATLPAPAPAEIIPAARRIDWQPGVPGGIPQRATICTTVDAALGDGSTDATAALQDALDACPAEQVVLLPPGTYLVSDTIHLETNKTLRGSGAGLTTIKYAGSSLRSILDIRGLVNWNITGLARSFAVTGGGTKGSTQITLADASAVPSGAILLVDQLNDGVLVDENGLEGACTYCGRANGTRARGQLAAVTAKSGNIVTIAPPLYFDLDAARSPEATLIDETAMYRRAGIEDLKLTEGQAGAVEFMIEMDGARECWLKGVEIERSSRRAVWLIESLQSEIRDSYFHTAIDGFGRDHGYGILVDAYSTACLVENNIFHTLDGGSVMAAGGAGGNVVAYNYIHDSMFDDAWWLVGAPILNHAPHPHMNLFEGNVGPQVSADFIHGSASHATVFRSRSFGWQASTITSNNNAVELQYRNTSMNVVGCVLGTAGQSDTYEQAYPEASNTDLKPIWRLGYGGPGGAGDPNVKATLLRHGNYDYVSHDTVWDPAIADHELPASLYRAAPPAWWGAVRWPAIGPDVEDLYHMIPAQLCYEAGPKVGLPFDPASCYAAVPVPDGGVEDAGYPGCDCGDWFKEDGPRGEDGSGAAGGGGGCGCTAADAAPGGVALLLLGAALAAARRRGARLR